MSKQAPLTWLRSFEASARYSSFTRAASELNITQAAVSKQIKALESQLHCQLFKRHAHGLSLTEQGRRYWLDTRELIQQLDNVTHQFLTRQQSNKIHIRCNISYSSLILASRLRAFKQDNPDITMEFTHDVWEPEKSSQNAHLEIGYRLIEKQSEHQGLCLLSQDQLFPVASPELSEAELAALPLIHVSGYYHEWRWWQEQLVGVPVLGVMGEVLQNHQQNKGQQDWVVDNSLIAYQLAEQGLGIALGRTSLVSNMLASNRVRCVSAQVNAPAPEGFYMMLSDLGKQQIAAQHLFHYLMP